MSGALVIRHLLANDASITAVVPSSRIMCGTLPQDIGYPAIAINQISGSQFNTLKMGESSYLVAQRVQVTVFAKDVDATTDLSGYETVKQILDLVINACESTRGSVNGINCDSIFPSDEGPDQYDKEALVYWQSQDFTVNFTR